MYAFAIHMTSYWFFSIIFYFIDMRYLDKEHINLKKYKGAFLWSFLNQIFITLPTGFLLSDYLINAIDRSKNDSLITTVSKVFLI